MVILDMLLSRLGRHAAQLRSRLKKGTLKENHAESAMRRVEVQELLHENMKTNREVLNCHSGFDDEADLWDRLFAPFLD